MRVMSKIPLPTEAEVDRRSTGAGVVVIPSLYVCGLTPDLPSTLLTLTSRHRRMRAHALQQKFTLNEHSLRPLGVTGTPGEPVPVTSEREIFEYLDFPYREPHERSE